MLFSQIHPPSLMTGGHIAMVFGWIIPCIFVMTVAASMAELTSSMPYVSGPIHRAYADEHVKDERRTVLLFCATCPATMGTPRMLDYRVGQRHRSSRSHVFQRLPHVRTLSMPHRPNSDRPLHRAEVIATALNIGSEGKIKLGPGPTYGLMLALLTFHGIICSFKTSILARINAYYAVLNRAS